MRCPAEVLDRGDEALGAGIQEMHGMGPIRLLAPCLRLLVFPLAEASGLAEANEPYITGSTLTVHILTRA
jgi:hypothetical protein